MSNKKVPVCVGDIEIGRASVEKLSDGTTVIHISIDNPDWGSWNVGGFAPLRLAGILPPNYRKVK